MAEREVLLFRQLFWLRKCINVSTVFLRITAYGATVKIHRVRADAEVVDSTALECCCVTVTGYGARAVHVHRADFGVGDSCAVDCYVTGYGAAGIHIQHGLVVVNSSAQNISFIAAYGAKIVHCQRGDAAADVFRAVENSSAGTFVCAKGYCFVTGYGAGAVHVHRALVGNSVAITRVSLSLGQRLLSSAGYKY